MGAVDLARALPDPEEMRRACVPDAGRRVLADERLLVVEQQRLVARPHVDLVDRALVTEIDPDRLHEPERAADLVRDHLVAPALLRAGDELLVPGVHLGQVGEAALRERAQQVERRDRLVVRLHHAARDRRHAPRLLLRPSAPRDPRNDGSSTPSTYSVGAERGFVNCPAIRPTLTTGSVAPYVSTADIWRSTLRRSRIATAETCRNDSAQSPACRRKARPSTASPSARRSARASPAKTSGGSCPRRSRTASDGCRVGPVGLLQGRQRPPRGRRPGLGHGHAASVSAAVLTLRAKTARSSGMLGPRPPLALLAPLRAHDHRRPKAGLLVLSVAKRAKGPT